MISIRFLISAILIATILIMSVGIGAANEVTLTLEGITADALPNNAMDVCVTGNHAYVADYTNGLVIVDISDPANPTTVGNFPSRIGNFGYTAAAIGVAVSGNYAYVANWYDDLYIIDVTDKTNPTLANTYNIDDGADAITISGDLAFIAAAFAGVDIIDISDPVNPVFIGNYNTDDLAEDVAIQNNYAYIADRDDGVIIVDVSDLANPSFVGSCDTPYDANSIVVSGAYAYVADADDTLIIDISNPAAPAIVGQYDTGDAWGIALDGNYVYVGDGDNGVVVLNVNDPANPVNAGSYDTAGSANGLNIVGNLVYVADGPLVILRTDASSTSGPVHNINKGIDYTTIQAAIDDASPGDEIHVDSGTYYENVVVDKQLTLRGINTGGGMPIVNANGKGNAITLNSGWSTIEGFNLINAWDFLNAGVYANSNGNFNIRNNTASNNSYGIYLINSSNNEINGNHISNNSLGIDLRGKSNTLISNNILNNKAGIALIVESSLLSKNNISNNMGNGIWLTSSNNNTLSFNNVSNNSGYYGIYVYTAYNNTLSNNNILNNLNGIGIRIWQSSENKVIVNKVSNNKDGISVEYYSDNKIYHNNIINNKNQGFGRGSNLWDDGYPSGGNYWSDYIGIDIKSGLNQDQPGSDGIGDTPYPIPGGSNVDRYPLMVPYSSPPSDYEGKLLRQTGDFKVFLIEDGKKRHFTSPEALEWNGYSFDDVIEVSEDVINSFEPGADISITQAIIDKYNALGGAATFGPPAGTGEQKGYPDSAGVICTYVNFQNGAIEYFSNGDQAGNAYAILNPFFDRWASMGYAKSVLGYPISDMSDTQTSSFGTPFKYQNFMNGTERGALEYNLSSGEVFEIHGAIYATWSAMGYANSILGLVTSDERDAVPSFKGTTGRVSDFENGHLHWHSSGEHYMVTYMTYGDLDELYISMGGTASWLGFPVMHQEDRGGYGYCEFEGGYIEWDVVSGEYIAKSFGITDGLVAEWHFDEGAGNILTDTSGNGNDGTIYGATWTTDGKFGSALQFDGVNDYVEVPDSSELSGGTGKNITVEFWFNSNKQSGSIITKWKDVSYKDWGATIGLINPGLSFWYEKYGNDRRFYGGTIQEGVWHHGAFTFEAESPTGANNAELTLYLDGNKVDLTFWNDHSPYNLLPNQLYNMPDTSAPVSIGYSGNYYNGGYFDGKIDEIKLFDRVLSNDEIKAEYERGGSAPTITISYPNGGEDWQASTIQTIQWSYTGDTGPGVEIEIFNSSGPVQTFTYVPIGSDGSGSYSWIIPENLASGTDYQVRITIIGSAYSDTSEYFTISAFPSDYEGKLLKQTGDFKVYLIEDGKKRNFTSPEALEWNGYSFDDVIEVSVDVINSFELGADISITQTIIDKYHALGGAATFGLPAGTGEQSGDPDNAGVICTYVKFQNGAIEYFTNGNLAGNSCAILNPFFDKWASMGYAKSVLGYPISDMSDSQTSSFGTPFKYQNFINGTERGALEYNLATGEVFEIHGAIYAKWEEKGFASGIMGLVTGDEKEAGKSPYGTTGRYSEFENGHIHWISDIGDDNAGKIYRGKAFATYGDLDWLYTNDGGTNGKLGFPVMDKYETTTYGHGECVFEGGKIIWDDYRGLHEIIYHGYLPDLTITDISFSNDNPVEGEPITIYAIIKNVGYTDAIGKFAVTFSQQSYYEDFETDETGSKAYIGQIVGENLGAGESGLVSMTWNAAPIFSTNPDGFINVEVDSSEEIEETNEYNNVEWGEVTISSRSNFKPEIDGYHFKNFPLTDAEIDKMIAEIGIWYDDDFYTALLPKENLDVLLKKHFSKSANCYGMSTSSTLYYHQLVPKPDDKDTFDLSKTDEVKQKIYDYQVMQAPYVLDELLRLIYQDIIPIWHHDVKIEYNIIKYHIENDEPIISNINYFYKDEYQLFKPPDGRHALTPFSTYEVSENIKNVLVYDSNHPGMARVVQFDFDNNKITYNDFDGKHMFFGRYSSTKYPLMTMDDAKNTFFDILKEFKKAFFKQLHDSKSKLLMFKCPIDITIIDQYGHIIDNNGNNEIPGAKVNIVGDLKMFLLPADLDYIIKIDAYDSGDFTFTQINPLTSEYATLISFVEVPITEDTKAISEVSSTNPEYKIQIDYDGDGIIDEIIRPDIIDIVGVDFYNITFFPPITTMDQFNLTDGSTLPIKFTAKNSSTNEFIYDDTVNVTITNSTGHLITYFTNGTGTDSVRINSEEEQYIVNFHTKDYAINIGETYSVTVTFGEPDSLRGYDITYFTLIEEGKAKGKGN